MLTQRDEDDREGDEMLASGLYVQRVPGTLASSIVVACCPGSNRENRKMAQKLHEG